MEIVRGTIDDPVYLASERARETFCQMKRERAGAIKRRPVKQNNYADKTSRQRFYAVAEMCAKQGWDVEVYVRQAFDIIHKSHNYVMPVDLTREQVSGAYAVREVTRTLDADPRMRFELQVRELLEFLKQPAGLCTEGEVLYSPLTPFEPWFRALYPEHTDERIFEIYGEAARKELAQDRTLRMFARKRFPRAVLELERRYGSFGDSVQGERHDR
jgi:hypothetical protein